MAHALAHSSSVASLLIGLICVGLCLHANARPSAVVNQICSKSTNAPFCHKVLNAEHTTDLKQLARITINYAQTNVSSNHKLTQSLGSQATNPTLKSRYNDCADHYDEAAGDIELALEHFKSGDFLGVNIAVSAVLTYADDCEDAWKTPPADPSQLPRKNKDLKDLCDVVLVISNLLSGRST